MGELWFGTSLLASFLGGVVALLAPCCVSVMLPAYLATGFRRGTGIVAGTLVFAAGVGTLIVPIGLGASAVSAALSAHHLLVFSIGGVAMGIGGIAMLAGWKPRLPIPSASPTGRGVTATYGLGLFSGIASACCAPVLAGVAVLSGASGSFLAALAIGLTYVSGMVAPLLMLALVWDRRGRRFGQLLHGRDVPIRIGRLRRSLPLGSLLSGLLLVGMGALTIVVAFTGPAMGNTGWRQRLSAELQHLTSIVTQALTWLPGWAFLLLLAVAATYVAWHVRRQARTPEAATAGHPSDDQVDGGARIEPRPDSAEHLNSQEVGS